MFRSRVIEYVIVLIVGIVIGSTWTENTYNPPESTLEKLLEEPQIPSTSGASLPDKGDTNTEPPLQPTTTRRPSSVDAAEATKPDPARVKKLEQNMKFDLAVTEYDEAVKNQDIQSELRALLMMESIDPNNPEYLETKVTHHRYHNEPEEARQAIESCLKVAPSSEHCLRAGVDVAFEAGDLKDRDMAIDRCLTATPGNVYCLQRKIEQQRRYGKNLEVIETYKQILNSHDPSDELDIGYIRYSLGFTLRRAGRGEEAETYFQQACDDGYNYACRFVR